MHKLRMLVLPNVQDTPLAISFSEWLGMLGRG